MNHNSKLENGIYYLFDKYLKSNDNYLPLKAYLQFIESTDDNLDGFSVISNVKLTQQTQPNQLADLARSANLTSTLNVIRKQLTNNSKDEPSNTILLAQKLYKIIITVDYSPHTSSLDFIKKGLEVIFEKISQEYHQYYHSCSNTEPQIYVTVILWNSSSSTIPQINRQDFNTQTNLPFVIILHSKRLLKSNLNEIALFIFNKINESKFVILDSIRNINEKQLRINVSDEEQSQFSTKQTKTKSSFEEFIRIIVKIFDYFCINEIITSSTSSAPTSLACSHHIHLTEGLIHATDMMKCLEKISKSAITFSFIYSGTSTHLTGSNISSSFGHLADYSLMKLIANISNGFYAYLDENLVLTELIKEPLFYFYKLSSSMNCLNSSKLNLNEKDDLTKTNIDSEFDDESRDTFCQKSSARNYDKPHIKANINNKLNVKKNDKPDRNDIIALFRSDYSINDQQFELRLIQKYELTNKQQNLLQICRIRVQEGFILSNITRKLIKSKNSSPKTITSPSRTAKSNFYLITLYFKKYFTQTTSLVYKISYFVQISCQNITDVSENESSSLDISSQTKNNQKLLVEIWISWSLLHLKAKYQNLELLKRVKLFLSSIQKADAESILDLTPNMFDPPEILKLKEPLYKLSNENLTNEMIGSNENIEIASQKPIFSLQNLNFELNMRINKNTDKDLFNEFASSWSYLQFFKLNKNILNRYFGTHSIKLTLDYDRPLPDINICIFDTKTRMIPFDMISETNLNSNFSPLNVQDSNPHNIHTHNHHLPNLPSAINNIFQCQNSVNKLRSMLSDWCDIVLVENCVYLKFLESSSKYLKLAYSKANKVQTPNAQQDQTKHELTESEVNDKSNLSIESQSESKSNMDSNVSNTSSSPSSSSSNNSFVIIITNEQYTPYVSLQFFFHSNISYLDRVRLLEKFKVKLRELNLKNMKPNSPVQISTNNVSGSLSSYSSTSQSNLFSSPNSKLNNVPIDENQIPRYFNFDYLNEYCHLLHKPELYDAFKFILFDELNHHQVENNSKLNQSSKLINFMHQKRFKWLVHKNFSNQTAQNLKETIIDTFVRIRLKEGFRCLFQCSKFVVFTLQLSMFDSGEISLEKAKTTTEPKMEQGSFKNGSSQICTFIYVIRFMTSNLVVSTSKKNGLLNIVTASAFNLNKSDENINQDDSKSNEIYFTTEIYVEAIDGIYQDRTRKISHKYDKEKHYWDYFRNLTNLEILNLIYLQDLKCFTIMQSSYALFLNKSNEVLNLSTLINKVDHSLANQNINSNLQYKDIFNNILNFNQSFYDSIRLLPDMSIILNKHTLKENKNTSTNKLRLNPNQYLFNRVNYNSRTANNRPLVTNTNEDQLQTDLQKQQQQQNQQQTNLKKKNLSLNEQLRPILDCIDITRFYMNTVEFDFTLKGILFESSLYVCVYEDIPFNLFNSSSSTNNSNSNKSFNKQENGCIKKLQSYFFSNIDDHFKKLEDNQDAKIIETMKKDVKNAVLLKLNDIKSGDSVIKKITENLRDGIENLNDFKVYIKFYTAQVTSKNPISSPNSQLSNHNKSDSFQTFNPWIKTSSNFMTQQSQQSNMQTDQSENNKFFIYGLFFLNSNSETDQSNSNSNRLVFYLFNCVPESIKASLIQTQSNTYLIRKPLFSTNANLTSDSYRFYISKNSNLNPRPTNNLDSKSAQKHMIKKFFSLSDIIKSHLSLSPAQNETLFLNLLDSIEENCAKSYIRSLIHYLATYSLEQSEAHECENNFEINSINRLLMLGTKIKLTDIDLTDFFKIVCKHMSDFSDWNVCSNSKSSYNYLEKKFDEIFLKRFNLLPGFNDLFIFTSTDNDTGSIKSEELLKNYENIIDNYDEDDMNDTSLTRDDRDIDNSDTSAEEDICYSESESLEGNESNYESDTNQAYYESDSNDQNQQTKTNFISLSATKTPTPRARSRTKNYKMNLKSSSPYATNLMPKPGRNSKKIDNQNSSSETSILINEQIIGIELVCQVLTEFGSDTMIESQSRTRTTTLTPDNAESLQTINENISIQQNQESFSTINTGINNTSSNLTSNQSNKLTFYSKFTKFNFACLLNLIESKDLNDFKSLVDKLGLVSTEKVSPDEIKGALSSIKIYLRFNWYSFNDLNISNNSMSLFSLNSNQQPPQLQKQMSHVGVGGASMSTHSSTSTVYNSGLNHQCLTKKINAKFEYNHLLEPSLREFKWHLKDEILHSQHLATLKNMKLFYFYINHIKIGTLQKFQNCSYEKKKIILSKTTETTTTSTIDAPSKSLAGKISATNVKKSTHIEEDKSILSVDPSKFFDEFTNLLKNLNSKFYKCSLQQMNENFYYLNCVFDDDKLTFKILISLKKETIKINPLKSNKTSVSPSSLSKNENLSSPKTGSNLEATRTMANRQMSQKASVQSFNDLQKTSTLTSFKQPSIKNTQIHQETTINQIKIKTYFSFNHSTFDQSSSDQESLIKHIILEFNKEIDNLINLSYLKLTLKDIDETRRWNNLLYLNDFTSESNLDTSLTSNVDFDETFPAKNVKVNDESINTIKNQNCQTSLACNCVWSVLFKLHRLHQTLQKVHDSSVSNSLAEKPSVQTSTTHQQYISQGLNKLREYLHNFKIYESTCGDLYVYNRNKEIYLLKLEEITEPQTLVNQQNNQSIITQSSTNQAAALDDSFVQVNENSVDLNEKSISASMIKIQQQQQQLQNKISMLSRRPSHTSINDPNEQSYMNTRMPGYSSRSQNLSGGSTAVTNPTQVNLATTNYCLLNTTNTGQKSNPEYIRLSVYGLQEPDEEMKQELCKTLQSELDYWLLNRMSTSIEKNTYKTTSAQHPDKITDEDLIFFKQICDNYLDFEIPLPFVFNFNKTLRENFFYFVKQVFNSNFKAIDASLLVTSSLGQLQTTSSTAQPNQSTKKLSADNDPESLTKSNFETVKSTLKTSSAVTTTTQPISCQFLTHQLSFSFISMQPVLGPFDLNKSKKVATDLQDPYTILLSRIFFQNAKRYGKHNVSLILVEALYSIKGLDYSSSSKVIRSNSIGSSSNTKIQQPRPQVSQNQMLETSFVKCREIGPTFVFSFYCRGENSEINSYKASLKSALNDALMYFLSEYLTKIDPELYLKKILLKKKPATFRVLDLNEQVSARFRKRHKSTGTTEILNMAQNLNKEFLRLNKTARETKLGRLLMNQKIIDETHLNNFIMSNFTQNLFDYRDYEDTIEYFRESIKSFDSNKILNSLVLNTSKSSLQHTYFLSTSCNENSTDSDVENDDLDSASNASSISSTSSLSSILQKPQRSLSMDPDMERMNQNLINESLNKNRSSLTTNFEKSHLRIIYDWLKGLYFIQFKSCSNQSTRSMGSISSFGGSISNMPQRIPSISSQPILNQQPIQSPVSSASTSNAANTNQPTSYILRKQFNYRTKYNLTSLVRDLEANLREQCKCELTVNYYSFKKDVHDHSKDSSFHYDNVFFEDIDPEFRKHNSQSSDNESNTGLHSSNHHLIDENDFGNDFSNLKQTKFSNLHNNLSKSENLIITMNAEYSGTSQVNIVNSGLSSLSLSMSSSINSSTAINSSSTVQTTNANTSSIPYTRVPSYVSSSKEIKDLNQNQSLNSSSATLTITGASGSSSSATSSSSQTSNTTMVNQTNTNDSNQINNIMMKSISSNSGELDSSLSLSNSLAIAPLQIKRTYCYAIVNAKAKTVIFYCFTTESSNYDSIKIWLEQTSDTITQRYHLVNNTVLYKFGGLIGDNLISDLKKVKQLAASASQQQVFSHNLIENQTSSQADPLMSSMTSQDFKNQAFKTQTSIIHSKQSKSPTMHRQLSYTKSISALNSQINPALITSLQFNSSNPSPQTSVTSTTTTSTTPVTNQQNQIFSIKQLFMNLYNIKQYDSIVNIINQQVHFCSQYLSLSTTATTTDHSSIISPNNSKGNNPNPNALTPITNTSNIPVNRASLTQPNLVQNISFNSLYGVGLCYQLYEMQQVFRHPRKIYDIGIATLTNQANISPNSSINNQNLTINKSQLNTGIKNINPTNMISPNNQQYQTKINTLNDFFKNCIQPVLVPFHYCCTPLLFYSNWNDSITSEKMLKLGNHTKSNKNELNKVGSNDTWYSKMRHTVLNEYTRNFESHGFIRLKDDRSIQQDSTIKTTGSQLNKAQLQQQQIQNSQNETVHFIKWIQQDGFLYLTMNLEEIYLHVRVGYCSRYRSASRLGFINEIIRFLTHEFHVHSFIYDFHLSAINTNFLSSQAGMQISQTSYIISKFLDEFVEFFSRVPLYSQNKVFKLIFEKSDNSLIPNKFKSIFDYIIYAKKKLISEKSSIVSFQTLYIFDNNIAIYTLVDNNNNKTGSTSSTGDCSKYLIVKIESFSREISSSSYSPVSSTKRLSKLITKPNIDSRQISISKYSNSSSSSSSLATNEKAIQTKQEMLIRITGFYLFINKNQQSGSFANTHLMNSLNDDLEFIKKVIEESINIYKQEIFWDNLTQSMYSLRNTLNENKNTNSLIVDFSVNSQELEQILAISQIINILDLDIGLSSFLSNCYLIKDKIKNNLTRLGKYFIYAESDTVEYCILLLNEDLIRNFRFEQDITNVNTNTQNQSRINSLFEPDQQLKSFILLKFDKSNETTQLMQVNRVKMSKQESIGNQSLTQTAPRRVFTNDGLSNLSISSEALIGSSFKNESASYNPNTSINQPASVYLNKTYKYLSFTVNILMFVLWESLSNS